MARSIDDDPKVICRSDPPSRDSCIEPIRSQVSKHPPGRVVLYYYYEELPPYFANGPAALVSLEINSAGDSRCVVHEPHLFSERFVCTQN